MGNGAMISTIDMVDYLAEDEDTKVICLFLEEISDPVKFAAAAEKADRVGLLGRRGELDRSLISSRNRQMTFVSSSSAR